MDFPQLPSTSILSLILAALFIQGCASVTPIPGGPEDTSPPEVITEKSTPNFQLQFEKQPIKLVFNEWVELKDVSSQIIVSPPLQFLPDIGLKGKSLLFRFSPQEVLRSDATYTINFGESVRDFTEGNPATDLRFVFSTGDQIDSLSVNGKVVDAFTGEPAPKVLVLLYEQLEDTVIRTERPFYFSRTNQQGQFRIENVRGGQFRLYALIDNNFNYLYDLPGESLAFLNLPVTVSDTTPAPLVLRLFQEAPAPRLLEAKPRSPGTFRMLLNVPSSTVTVRSIGRAPDWNYLATADSLVIWHTASDTTSWSLVVRDEDKDIDTVTITSAPPSKLEGPLTARSNSLVRNAVPSGESLQLTFSRPIKKIDSTRILLLRDSLPEREPVGALIEGEARQSVRFSCQWADTSLYSMTLLPGAISDIFGQTHDTIRLNYKILAPETLSGLTINIDSFPTGNYVLFLLQKDKEIRKSTFRIPEKKDPIQFPRLLPGTYSIRIIEDKNENGRWDPGQLEKGRQPENLTEYPLEELRPNWEVVKVVTWPENIR